MPPTNASLAAQVALLSEQVAEQSRRTAEQVAEQTRRSAETNKMVQQMHHALMQPSPGQEHSLLDRMAAVTISIEAGARAETWLKRGAAFLAAIGSIYLAIRYGIGGKP